MSEEDGAARTVAAVVASVHGDRARALIEALVTPFPRGLDAGGGVDVLGLGDNEIALAAGPRRPRDRASFVDAVVVAVRAQRPPLVGAARAAAAVLVLEVLVRVAVRDPALRRLRGILEHELRQSVQAEGEARTGVEMVEWGWRRR